MNAPIKSPLDVRIGILAKQAHKSGLTYSEACDLHRDLNRMLSSLRSGGRKRTRKSDRAMIRALRAKVVKKYQLPSRKS